MNHPSHFFIKYLLSSGAHSYDEILSIMEMYGLGGITKGYLSALEENLKYDRPIPFRPRSLYDRASQKWLLSHGISKAWHRDEAQECCMELLARPRVVALVETFILAPVTAEQAVAKINEREPDADITAQAYERFRHYFWNPKLLNGAEWGEFIDKRRASHSQWLRLAVNARGPEGVQLLLWRAGVGSLKNLDRAKIFTDFRNIAYMKAKEMESNPAGVDDSKALLNYARVARSAQEEVNNSSDAVNDILEGFNAFRMRRKDITSPSVQQLTGGDYTSSQDLTSSDDEID